MKDRMWGTPSVESWAGFRMISIVNDPFSDGAGFKEPNGEGVYAIPPTESFQRPVKVQALFVGEPIGPVLGA